MTSFFHRPRRRGTPGAALAFLAGLFWTASPVRGQVTTATCGSGFGWATNSQGLSPCALASNVLGSQYPTPPFTLSALDPNWMYPGPTIANDASWYAWNRALCSMPAYNLLAACEDCQARSWVDWGDWTQSCNSSFTGDNLGPRKAFPTAYPSNVSVPSWVAHDSSANAGGSFDAGIMSSLASGAGATSSGSAAPTSSAASGVSTVSSGVSVSVTTAAGQMSGVGVIETTPASGSSSAPGETGSGGADGATQGGHVTGDTGAIIGGVIGGLAILSLFVGLLFWMVRSARRRDADAALVSQNARASAGYQPDGVGYADGRFPQQWNSHGGVTSHGMGRSLPPANMAEAGAGGGGVLSGLFRSRQPQPGTGSAGSGSRHRFNKPMEDFFPQYAPPPASGGSSHGQNSWQTHTPPTTGGSSAPLAVGGGGPRTPRTPGGPRTPRTPPDASPSAGSHSIHSHGGEGAGTAVDPFASPQTPRERRPSVGSTYSTGRPSSLYGNHVEGALAAVQVSPRGDTMQLNGGGEGPEILREEMRDLRRPDEYPQFRR